ncbi:MAG: SusC/RagA family TonB-linked outer membrane protein, partial [Bacteroidota bacterium]
MDYFNSMTARKFAVTSAFKTPNALSIILIALSIMLCAGGLFAQSGTSATIKGTIVDLDSKKPLKSATVTIPSLRLGAVTDDQGKFSFKVPPGNHNLEVRYVGYQTLTRKVSIKADQTSTLDLKIAAQSIQTNEIVVVGLSGEVDRSKLGNTIATVDGKEIAKVVSTSAIDAISGRVTGVNVTKNSGTPGSGTYITMRGRKTISGSSEPLYVVDGILMDNTSLYDGSGTKQFSNRAVDINPQDIESIEILKGASAAAIYGSQAGNGVVLITTKRGKLSSYEKPAQISFTTSLTMDQKSGSIPLQTIYGQRVPYKVDPVTGIGKPGKSDSYAMDANGLPMPLPAGTQTYKQDNVPFRDALSHEQSLTISGGVPQFDYLLNGTYSGIQGYVIGSDFSRANIRANVGISILPGLTLQTNNNYIAINNDLPQDGSNTSGILLGALRTPPEFDNTKYLEPDGTQRRFASYDNPLWTQNFNKFNSKINRFLNSTEMKWTLFDWVNINGRFGYDSYEYANTERLAVGSATSDNREGLISDQNIKNNQMNLDFTANFSQRFMDDEFSTNLVLGTQIIWSDSKIANVSSTKTTDGFDQIGAGATKDGSSYFYEKKIVGLFGQFTGSWLDRYALTLALRRDGSSTFGKSKQFHYYPKASVAYSLSNEPFMKDMKDIFSLIRLRASYGEAGSPNLPGAYSTNFLYGTSGFFDPWDRSVTANRAGYIGYRQGGGTADEYIVYGAEDILPERSIEREVGIDMGFFDNLVTLEATFYHSDVQDMILSIPVPTSTGYDMA